MFGNQWHKKEKPLPSMIGMGGGATSLQQNAGSPGLLEATGGTKTTDGDYTVHTFTSPGTFTVDFLSAVPANNNVIYLVIGGGGGGGCHVGGGGGAGGVVSNHPGLGPSPLPQQPTPSGGLPSPGDYSVTIGAGGAGTSSPTGAGTKGGITSLNGLAGGDIDAYGGGGGASNGHGTPGSGPATGSGGGDGHANNPSLPGPQLAAPISPGTQGHRGGTSYNPHQRGGGGGGAAAVGTYGGPGGPGDGGAGVQVNIDGNNYYWAGGGGGGKYTGTNLPGGDGGIGGGGGGGSQSGTPGGSGGGSALNPGISPTSQSPHPMIRGGDSGANTGGGGGGAGHPGNTGGAGGPGIVIIRYLTG